MSSTNRGGVREVSDYYVTPPDHVRMFLVEFFDDLAHAGDQFMAPGRVPRLVLDPCAGGDVIHGMSYPDVLSEWGNMLTLKTIDIRDDSKAEIKGDYLKISDDGYKPEMIITNPPFALAEQIIEKAINEVADKGFVVMLLRLNFLESRKRYEFIKRFKPWRIYVHAKRMSFTNVGGTDSIAYAHFVWCKGVNPEFSQLKVIDFEDPKMF